MFARDFTVYEPYSTQHAGWLDTLAWIEELQHHSSVRMWGRATVETDKYKNGSQRPLAAADFNRIRDRNAIYNHVSAEQDFRVS